MIKERTHSLNHRTNPFKSSEWMLIANGQVLMLQILT